MKYKDIIVGGKLYAIYYVQGGVVGKDKQMETRVHGGGGGGATYQGTGGTAPISISSTSTIHDKVYLDTGNGKEAVIEVQDWDIACREGHRMTVVWVIGQGKNSGPYVGFANHTTDELFVSKLSLERLLTGLASMNIGSGGLIAFAFAAGGIGWFIGAPFGESVGSVTAVLGFIGFFILKFYLTAKVKNNVTVLDSEIRSFLNNELILG